MAAWNTNELFKEEQVPHIEFIEPNIKVEEEEFDICMEN